MDSLFALCKNQVLAPLGRSIATIGKQYYQRLEQQQPPPNSKDNMDTVKPNTAPLILSYEKYLLSLQSLLLWHQPQESLVALAMFTIAYWCLVLFSASMLSLIFTSCFVFSFLDIWRHKIWPEIRVPPTQDQLEKEAWMPVHPQALSGPELINAASNLMEVFRSLLYWLLDLRAKNHAFFCFLVSSVLTMTAIAGQMVPGSLLLYSALMILALTPGFCVHILPSGWPEWIFGRKKNTESNSSPSLSPASRPSSRKSSSSLIEQLVEDLSARSVNMFDSVTDHFKDSQSQNDPTLKQLVPSDAPSSLLEREIGFIVSSSSSNCSRSCSQEKDLDLASRLFSSSIFASPPSKQQGTSESPSSLSGDEEEDAFVMISDKDLSQIPSHNPM